MTTKIVLKCDLADMQKMVGGYAWERNWDGPIHDAIAAACYSQAIEDLAVKVSSESALWIEQRAAELLAEKMSTDYRTCGEFVMVPREMSERMLEAGKDRLSRARLRKLWRDLIAAGKSGKTT